ncbi:putative odorant receptor 92a [Sitophilus oryzae]|uniref:Odorant receptor n=1 Tax=Sitophilus oryzae TaxID=7048 RepID=A0A6J2XWB4_SITOR|nr:putative odorant receptor 92a [Sitophilus oryzae]
MSENPSDFFAVHEKICKFFLLIPPKNPALRRVFWTMVSPHLFLIMCPPIMEFLQIVVGGTGNFSSDMLIFAVLMMHGMAVGRLIGYLMNRRHHGYILRSFRRSTFHFELFKYSNLMFLRQKNKELPNKRPHIIDTYKTNVMRLADAFCFRWLCILIISVFSCLFVTYVVNSQTATYEKFNPKLNRTSVYRDYAYALWYPFDTSVSDGFYYIGFFYQPYAFFMLMSSYMCIFMFNLGCVIYLKSHANVVGYSFKFIDQNIDEMMSYNEVMSLKEIRIVKCINELQEIYKCASLINNILANQMLLQIFFVGLITCIVIYRVESVKTIGEIVYLTIMTVVFILLGFFMCWYNQEFTLEIMNISKSVHELEWNTYSARLLKTLIFLMARLQKPFYFTLGQWTPIDIGAFLVTIKMSYSFYTLIRTRGYKRQNIN